MENLKQAKELVKVHLTSGENIEKSVFGMFQYQLFGAGGQRKGILIATNKRICFYTKHLGSEIFEEFEYRKIESIEVKKGLLSGSKIIFYHDGNREMMNLIHEGDIEEFVNIVKGKMRK